MVSQGRPRYQAEPQHHGVAQPPPAEGQWLKGIVTKGITPGMSCSLTTWLNPCQRLWLHYGSCWVVFLHSAYHVLCDTSYAPLNDRILTILHLIGFSHFQAGQEISQFYLMQHKPTQMILRSSQFGITWLSFFLNREIKAFLFCFYWYFTILAVFSNKDRFCCSPCSNTMTRLSALEVILGLLQWAGDADDCSVVAANSLI